MLTLRIYSYIFIIFILSLGGLKIFAQGPIYNPWIKINDEAINFTLRARNVKIWANSNGFLGLLRTEKSWIDSVHFEYPIGSGLEHLGGAGLWVGAKVLENVGSVYRVTEVYGVGPSVTFSEISMGWGRTEMKGYHDQGDTIWKTSTLNTWEPNRRGFDDDGDGCIDEDPLDGIDNDGDWLEIRDDLNKNGKPNHGEPNVDEDHAAISEEDIYVAYRDTFSNPTMPNHVPMGIKVRQKSYAWPKTLKEPIIFIEYNIINESSTVLDSVYAGLLVSPYVGRIPGPNYDICDSISPYKYQTIGYLPSAHTVFVANYHFSESTPFGITLLDASRPLQDLKVSLEWYTDTLCHVLPPIDDRIKYRVLSSGRIKSCEPTLRGLPLEFIVGVGPLGSLNPGDTVQFSIAIVAGLSVDLGYDNIRRSAAKAIEIYNRGYYLYPIHSPPLKISPIGERHVKLDWTWYDDYRFPNPMEAWDSLNRYLESLPDTHWRRRNPPPGATKGGRVFEGFKVWRGEFPLFDEHRLGLLKQFDVNDDLGFNSQTGLQFTLIDSMIYPGKRYWYSVTSFTIPDYIMSEEGDTLHISPGESSLHENAINYQAPFNPSTTLNKVKVVPNPYRTDQDYTFEGGGWEGLGRLWNEYNRQIWFIHLPSKCTIRIFTIAGEVVATLYHDDTVRMAKGLPPGQHEWFLLSESNRAIASGVYIFLVESEYGTQTGKFVVIR